MLALLIEWLNASSIVLWASALLPPPPPPQATRSTATSASTDRERAARSGLKRGDFKTALPFVGSVRAEGTPWNRRRNYYERQRFDVTGERPRPHDHGCPAGLA